MGRQQSWIRYIDGFSIQELYRGLSPQQGFEQKEMGTGEIYATVFSTEEGGALKAQKATEVFLNKLRK